ncbi:hypothetical protein F5Y16DRAFT_419316 [Xylariaceae sp. FL0255]|nr:hypothetical protein F5Y16DRAFT_419316 [Xylariaceae sp. FL0255]
MLLQLPVENFLQILVSLIDKDLQSALLSQRVCRTFRDGIITALRVARNTDDLKVHPLWVEKFGHLFNARYALSKVSLLCRRIGDHYVKDGFEPFRNLPWAKTRESRELYLHPCASWREISVTFGGPPITCVDVVHIRCFDHESATAERLFQAEPIYRAAGLTMGAFYDLLADGSTTIGISEETTSWEFLPGCRLAVTMDELRALGLVRIRDIHTRILFSQGVKGHAVLLINSFGHRRDRDLIVRSLKRWVPTPIGPAMIRFFPWYGCLNNMDIGSLSLLLDPYTLRVTI